MIAEGSNETEGVITIIYDKAILSAGDLAEIVKVSEPRDLLMLTLLRDGEAMTVDIEVRERTREPLSLGTRVPALSRLY